MSQDTTSNPRGTTIAVSRTLFVILCFVTVLLFVVLLICWSNIPDRPPSELEKVLANEEFPVVALIDLEGRFTLFDPDGVKIEPCGVFDGTSVPKDCRPIRGETTHKNALIIDRREASDPCLTLWDVNYKKQYDVHTRSNLAGKGKKCHHAASATHKLR